MIIKSKDEQKPKAHAKHVDYGSIIRVAYSDYLYLLTDEAPMEGYMGVVRVSNGASSQIKDDCLVEVIDHELVIK